MAVKISKIPLPHNYDPKMNAKIALIGRQKLGEDYEFSYVDEENGMAVFSRKIEISKVRGGAQRGKEVDLTSAQRSPSAGERVAGYYEAQESFQGLTMTQFDPHRGTATFMPLTENEVITRAAIAEVLGVKPWEVEVKEDPRGGYRLLRVPGKYTPSKHDSKLTEAAETKIPGGEVGWFVAVDGKTLTGRVVPAELPTFPDTIPYPMRNVKGDPNHTPFGMKLARPGGENELAQIDWLETTSLMLAGLPSSGKRQPLNTPIPVPISEKYPDGWATIGDLEPGDQVYQRFGHVATLKSKTKPISRPTYKFTFGDGQVSLSDEDHLWLAAPHDALEAHHTYVEAEEGRIEQILKVLQSHVDDNVERTVSELAKVLDVSRSQVERARESVGCKRSEPRANTGLIARTLIGSFDAEKRLRFLDEARHSESVGTVTQIAEALVCPPSDVIDIIATKGLRSCGTTYPKAGSSERAEPIYRCGDIARDMRAKYQAEHRSRPVYRVVTSKEIAESTKAGNSWRIPVAGAIEGVGGSKMEAEEQAHRVVEEGGEFTPQLLRAEFSNRLHALRTVAKAVGAFNDYGEYALRLPRDRSVRSVVELARSLGMLARQSQRAPLVAEIVTSENLLGDGKRGTVPDVARWNPIRSVEYVGETTGCCISVDDPTHTYLTGQFLVTHNTVTINALIFGKLATGGQVIIVDTPDKSADFLWMKDWVWPGGWGCESDRAAVASLKLAYEEGQRRAQIIKESNGEWVNWQDMPKSKRFVELFVIADEYSALSVSDPVPKELPKDHPMRIEVEEANLAKAMFRSFVNKLIKEMRFVGIHVLVSSQVTSASTGLPPALKNAIGGKMLQGVRPSPAAKNQAFSDPKQVPDVPGNIAAEAGPARGTGAAELTGQDPFVYKSFYASPRDYRSRLEELKIPKTSQQKGAPGTSTPEPRAADIDRIIPSSLGDDSMSAPPSRLETEGGFGEYQGKDVPLRGAAAAAHQLALQEAQDRENKRRATQG